MRYIKAKPEELEGLPQDYISSRAPDENGYIEISTRYPDLVPVISYAENDDVKKRLWFAFWQRGYPENEPVVAQLLQKRYEYAQLLGYENYAQYVLSDELQSEYTLFPANKNQYLYTSFTHLNGYSAAYYTYLWSLAISTDILSEFNANGMMDRPTADHYRKSVLEKGGSKPADELVADFLGRPVSFDAYAKKLKAYSTE